MRRLSGSKFWTLFIAAVVIMVSLSVVGCQPPEEEVEPPEEDPDEEVGPTEGGTVRIAISSDPENLNPLILPTGVVAPVFECLFNGLVRDNPDWEWVPDAAEDWEVSDDGRTVTFFLHDDITFHDGEPMTAHDVKFTLQSMAHPDYIGGQFGYVSTILGAEEYREGEADDVEGLEVIDDHTIAITTVEPDASIFNTVSRGIAAILPEHILGDVPHEEWQRHEFNQKPIGTGPFKIVEREADSHLTLEAHDDYFKGRPYIDRLIFRIGDDQAMLGAFMNEEVDIIEAPAEEVETVEDLPFANVHVHEGGSFNYLGLNNLHPCLGQPEVRQAIATALNIKEITATATQGYGEPIIAPHTPSSWAYPADCEGWPYDPDKAAEMLDDLGWEVNPDTGIREKDGVKMSYDWYNVDRDEHRRIASLVQQNLEDVNIELDIQVIDFATMTHVLLPRDADGAGVERSKDDFGIYTLGLTVGPDPQGMERQFHSRHSEPGGHNYVSYSNERVDELWGEVRTALDLDQRRELAQELYSILCREVPWIPLYATTDISVAHDRVQGFEPNVLGQVWNVTEWWVDDGS